MASPTPLQGPEIVARRIELALRMLELGAWIFPLAPNAKEPWVSKRAGGGGFHDAKPDPELARTFLSNPGQLNYGVVFPEGSDVVVLDIDGGDRSSRPDWVEEWHALYEQHGPPGLTYIVRTPSSGRHAYYRWRTDLYGPIPPGDEMLGWTVRKPWKGYVVGPGSVVRGQVYEPVGADLIADLAGPWCLAALDEKKSQREPVITVAPGGPADVKVGGRHRYLRDRARALLGAGLRGEALYAAVADLNQQLAEPKTEAEVRRAIGEVETKFEPDRVDPETGERIHAAQSTAAMGRKKRPEPEILPNLVFRTASEISGMTPEVIDWAWRDYLAHGTIVEIVGPPKAGKTTLVFGLIRAYTSNHVFLDRPTAGGPVVLLSEQGPTSLRAALERTGIANSDDVHVLLHRDARGHEWPDLVATASARCRDLGSRLLVVDTLPAFTGLTGDAENSAGDALEAMEPLLHAASEGIAVLVNRHRRKTAQGGGPSDIADEGRGSGAFSGAVDVILSLRRVPGGGRPTVRELLAASRFDETPERLVVELDEGRYVALGDDAAIETAEAREGILRHLLGKPDGLSLVELVDVTGKSRATVQRVLTDLVKTEDIARHGHGAKGSPYRWRIAPEGPGILSAQTPTPYGGEVNGGLGQRSNPGPDCRQFLEHQSFHRQTPSGWTCDACYPEETA